MWSVEHSGSISESGRTHLLLRCSLLHEPVRGEAGRHVESKLKQSYGDACGK